MIAIPSSYPHARVHSAFALFAELVLTRGRYVHRLEERLRALENSALADNSYTQPRASPSDNVYVDGVLDDLPGAEPLQSYQPAVPNANVSRSRASPLSSRSTQPIHVEDTALTSPQYSTTFEEELRTLSLAVAAERHLGSTSGLSFAKLTQTVLRRLTPDKADFVFINHQKNIAGAALFDLDSPSDCLGESVFQNLSESVSAHPVLFGDLFLADLTVSDSLELRTLAWPSDDKHIYELVHFYFSHSHTLYPILRKSEIMETLQRFRNSPSQLDEQAPLEVFRLWMVLAIGSTAYSSIASTEESESRLYYSKALQYSELALDADEMVSHLLVNLSLP